MMARGEFTRPAGLIYDRFDPRRHVRPRFALPEEWNRYAGLDFGAVNTAGVFLAEEESQGRPTGRYVAYRTYHPGRKMEPAEHYGALVKGEPRLPVFVGGARSEDEWRERFSAAGIPVCEPPVHGVEPGIDTVYELIATDKLIVMDDLADLLDELGEIGHTPLGGGLCQGRGGRHESGERGGRDHGEGAGRNAQALGPIDPEHVHL